MTPPLRADLVIRNASVAATPAEPTLGGEILQRIPHAAMAGRDGRIVWIGPEHDLPASLLAASPQVLDAGGGVLMPGFIDPHTHAVFSGWREQDFVRRLQGHGYADIAAAGGGIATTVRATRAAREEDLAASLLERLDRMLALGVTTVEVKSGYGLDLEAELRQLRAISAAARAHPVRLVPTFMGAHAVPPEYRDRRQAYIDLVTQQMLPAVAAEGLATFCDVFVDTGAFTLQEGRQILAAARDLGLQGKVHADELTSCGGAELAAEMGAVSAEHLLHASDAGIAAMAAAGVVAVLLPATSFLLRETPAQAERFRQAGCAIAVGTDFNPGSSPCEALPLAAAMGCIGNGLTPDEAIVGITASAAAATGLATETGSLRPGMSMDVVVLDAPDPVHLVYRFGANLVRDVVARGRIAVRDGALMAR